MTDRRLSNFIDALAAGRRPEDFQVDPADVEVVRAAITLRAARPGDAAPDEEFVSGLFEELAQQANPRVVPITRPAKVRRRRAVVVAVAAGLVLVGGTTVATGAFDQAALAPAAVQAPSAKVVRTGTFETADNQVLGQIVVYRGNPSWVYMNVDVPNYHGPITCMLQVEDGSTVAAGTFETHGGIGEHSKIIRVDVGQLRGAKLVNAAGVTVAAATFA
jgi:hypothetical protein